jgi:hypothetical protein
VRIVKRSREDEAARRAPVVIDGDSGDLEGILPIDLATFVEIDHTVTISLLPAALARDVCWADRLHFHFHGFLSPIATPE